MNDPMCAARTGAVQVPLSRRGFLITMIGAGVMLGYARSGCAAAEFLAKEAKAPLSWPPRPVGPHWPVVAHITRPALMVDTTRLAHSS